MNQSIIINEEKTKETKETNVDRKLIEQFEYFIDIYR